jgi:hypothetical protein
VAVVIAVVVDAALDRVLLLEATAAGMVVVIGDGFDLIILLFDGDAFAMLLDFSCWRVKCNFVSTREVVHAACIGSQ